MHGTVSSESSLISIIISYFRRSFQNWR